MILAGKTIVLGLCGGIAAYKVIEVARQLTVAGATVDTVMTEDAPRFVTPLTLQTLTHRPVLSDTFRLLETMEIPYVSLGQRADAMLVAPATANTLAKMAQGQADNLLLATYLATTAPVVVAPAMDAHVWQHPATQANTETLRQRGAIFVGPDYGPLVSGLLGSGRLAAAHEIIGTLRQVLGREGPLAGRHVLVTAGGTREPLDPVRYLGNRSSGKMGYALAQAALDRGASVTLVTAPTALQPPVGAHVEEVETAQEMRDAALDALAETDALLMAAAVADFRPARYSPHKIKKGGQATLAVTLERNPDILMDVVRRRLEGAGPLVVAGFVVETEDTIARAREKLLAKGLDLVVANDVSAPDSGLEADTLRATLLGADSTVEALPLMGKDKLAEHVLDRVVAMLDAGRDA
ncbi:MAG TPA: bifunctional phosphopantothenoylcysteine decarboxylase/phosphopantothenate--cysteine ligase CoaBC [Anaerolineae bacterium]|nr:bifunctional phosphopantothenoylcysteine decarboxylase/phosphopantothenate--cysteine ligase CoaBC [Anaerolineae bacterium]HPL30458.1 bifunctional phosphopantothenoylcysteine decarboxylase/phosphopantothenate--cysteine ligase CoaBC [Anaerolineae bacterium]